MSGSVRNINLSFSIKYQGTKLLRDLKLFDANLLFDEELR